MSSLPINLVPKSTAVTDAVVERLNQLPVDTQQQVLDYVEFLLHRHKLDEAVEPFDDDVEEDLTVWEAATDEDWLALEAQLAEAKSS
ncbi:hypothetical protein IQ260_27070 [Leptolyngbya cf. ectocarpi LEGE 11479]|uniref:DUF2281 domain-containing protein n=1 Tax=Leptolyngbya cf. ectocarpi LEGE 11479 TaxID=1828722 RepID=A0A928ZZD8_LEPEC|nr:hypothetical protein [Leptolyngbya ectocarpi]MBE9070309.1 hypothetical protein [Leptolyngbya cf. ectocarpi LEGE 11479]